MNLDVGFNGENATWEVIVKFYGTEEELNNYKFSRTKLVFDQSFGSSRCYSLDCCLVLLFLLGKGANDVT